MKISLSLPDDLVMRIDKLRGDIPRSRYVKRLLVYALGKGGDSE